jgi:hypothetical protein
VLPAEGDRFDEVIAINSCTILLFGVMGLNWVIVLFYFVLSWTDWRNGVTTFQCCLKVTWQIYAILTALKLSVNCGNSTIQFHNHFISSQNSSFRWANLHFSVNFQEHSSKGKHNQVHELINAQRQTTTRPDGSTQVAQYESTTDIDIVTCDIPKETVLSGQGLMNWSDTVFGGVS